MAKHHCPVPECADSVPERYFMCPRHWRLVPRDVRRAWTVTLIQYLANPTRYDLRATIENGDEVVRIVAAIEQGVRA